jgi:SAM-dependent methyltransferase
MLKRLRNRPRIFGIFSLNYVRRQKNLLTGVLSSPEAMQRFREGGELPEGYGRGFDERVVEYPWVLSRPLTGNVLDAGSTFNFPHVLDAVQSEADELTIVTLAPEPRSFPDRGVSYVYADLRDLPLRDALFDAVVSISTLEHVGMDNSLYATGAEERAADPEGELDAALAEIRRVAKPGGRLLITVPYGAPEDLGWLRQFDAAGIEGLIRRSGGEAIETTVFLYSREGWRRSTLEEAATAGYHMVDRDRPAPGDDGAVAARAVACLDLRLP